MKEKKIGKIRRVHRTFIKAKNKAHRIAMIIVPVALYLAGDYAQDGVIDGSLFRDMMPYLQQMAVTI